MKKDMCISCDEGFINIRVGAIILKDGHFLMAGNDQVDYLYSVGGRLKFGETAEEAVVREVLEETGVQMDIDHLGFVHECYFMGDFPDKLGKTIYELSFYFYMKVPDDFEPVSNSFTENDHNEYLEWVSADTTKTIYPAFFRTELNIAEQTVKHFVTDERGRIGHHVTVTVDRPLGSSHPKYPDMQYPVNYGYVKGVMAADGEEQDAYVIGVEEPVKEFTGILIAIIHRQDDVEDKWVVAPIGKSYTKEEILRQVAFQEKYFHIEIQME